MSKQTFHFLVAVEAVDEQTAVQIMRERICPDESYDFPGGDDYSIGFTEQNAPVFVVQSEEGDIVDVTTSEEWARHLTRDDDDTPIRTLHEDTLWDGPEDRSQW